MHDDGISMIKKRKKLIEIEIMDYKSLKLKGKRAMHRDDYYINLGKAWFHLHKAERYLTNSNKEVYNDYYTVES